MDLLKLSGRLLRRFLRYRDRKSLIAGYAEAVKKYGISLDKAREALVSLFIADEAWRADHTIDELWHIADEEARKMTT